VDPGNVKDLIDGIITVVKDSGLRKRIGKKAREDAVERYSWDANIERLMERYDR